jgi:sucrose-phosphate synthase
MHVAFLNPQGNFDPQDRFWTEHPDFGGQLVYVKEVALALGQMGHRIDILTRRIRDPEWPGFESELDGYPGASNVRIVRLPCGGDRFLRKEELWTVLGPEWVPDLAAFYAQQGSQPDAATAHYADGGLSAALWQAQGGPPFTFTGHSLGAQKLDRLLERRDVSLRDLDKEYHFGQRIAAERVAISHAGKIITSTQQERWEQYGHPAYRSAVDPAHETRFAVVRPGVNLSVFGAEPRGAEDRRIAAYLEAVLRRDIAVERRALPAILCSSRLDAKKNHVGLVQAFAQSAELQRAANLLLVIRGAEDIHTRSGFSAEERSILDQIVVLCEAANLWGKVSAFSLEGQDALAAAYRHLVARRSAFALTALYEPFGLAPLEAMATGLPVAVTRHGGPSESLADPETGQEFGVLVDPADAADIARGVLRLVGPDNEWEVFHAAGRERVLTRYTWTRTAEGYLAVLQDMLSRPVPASASRLPIPPFFVNPAPELDLDHTSLGAWRDGARAGMAMKEEE